MSTQCEHMCRRGRCTKPTKDASRKCHLHKNIIQEESNHDQTSSRQCEYMCKKGQCTKTTRGPSARCHLHRDIVDTPTQDIIIQVTNHSTNVQCEGITLSGNRCKKNTSHSSRKCKQHQIHIQPTIVVTSVAPPRPRRVEEQRTEQQRETGIETRSSRRIREEQELREKVKGNLTFAKSIHSDKKIEVIDLDKDEKQDDCCICYESVPESEFLDCQHVVCKGCVRQLRDTRCPMCRSEIKSKSISEKEKRKMILRREQDSRTRNHELLMSYLQTNITFMIE